MFGSFRQVVDFRRHIVQRFDRTQRWKEVTCRYHEAYRNDLSSIKWVVLGVWI